jgi:N-methylhydantoinase A
VTLRLRSTIKPTQARLTAAANQLGMGALAGSGRAKRGLLPDRMPVFLAGKKVATAIHTRDSLQIGKRYAGPAVVTEYSATTVVPPGRIFWLDKRGNLLISKGLL